MRSRSRRQGRSLFLYYLCATYLAIFMAAPLVRALEPAAKDRDRQAAGRASASAGASGSARSGAASAIRRPGFEECDRNGDGFVDKSEAASVPGLSANFERVDTNKDGRLDAVEFEKALAFLESQSR